MAVAPATSECVCTTLRMASRVITRHYDLALAPAGLTSSAYAILSRLDQEGQSPLGALAARLAMDRSTLSREIAPLIASGLIDDVPDERDGRKRLLGLSSAGDARVREVRPLWESAQAALTAGFGARRTAELLGELHELVGAGA